MRKSVLNVTRRRWVEVGFTLDSHAGPVPYGYFAPGISARAGFEVAF